MTSPSQRPRKILLTTKFWVRYASVESCKRGSLQQLPLLSIINFLLPYLARLFQLVSRTDRCPNSEASQESCLHELILPQWHENNLPNEFCCNETFLAVCSADAFYYRLCWIYCKKGCDNFQCCIIASSLYGTNAVSTNIFLINNWSNWEYLSRTWAIYLCPLVKIGGCGELRK